MGFHDGPSIEVIDKKPCLSMRWVLAILGLIHFSLITMIKNSFSIAIVAMVNSTTSEENTHTFGDVCPAGINASDTEDNSANEAGEFNWTLGQQGLILSAFVWGSFIGRCFGGRSGEVFGQRFVIAVVLIVLAGLELISPLASRLGPYCILGVRFVMGALHGISLAAYQSLLSRWAPRNELSSMMTTAFTGIYIGNILGAPTAGWIVENSNWRWVFWSEGIVICLFVPFWIILVRNNPDSHPFVTSYENKILDENKNVVTKQTVPWVKIAKSPYVYVIILAQFSRSWNDGIINAEGPTFFNKKLGLDLDQASFIIAAYSFIGVISILIYGRIADLLIRKQWFSVLGTRRIMHIIGVGVVSVLYFSIGLANCRITLVIVLWLLLPTMEPATGCSINASVVDLTPNYTGTIVGIIGFGNIGGSLSPILTSYLVQQERGWRNTFFIAGGIAFSTCLVYCLTMTDQIQPWNYYEDDENKKNKLSFTQDNNNCTQIAISNAKDKGAECCQKNEHSVTRF